MMIIKRFNACLPADRVNVFVIDASFKYLNRSISQKYIHDGPPLSKYY